MTVSTSDLVDDVARTNRGDDDRLVYVDVLRVALIVLVVAHHSAQAYGPTGGDWPVEDRANSDWLGPFFAVNAAVGLGLLFLLAGYFVPRSYDRKGASRFVRDRWQRIGVPLAFSALVVHLPVVYLMESPRPSFGDHLRSQYDDGWQGVYIHLWFLGHLLLYSLVYVGWRRLTRHRTATPARAWSPPGHLAIIGFVVGLTLVTWVVRGWFAIDEWTALLGVLATEPAHLPQYVALFAIGVAAYRGDWLRRWPTRTGIIWLAVGITSSVGMATVMLRAPDRYDDLAETGGFNLGSLTYSAWEAVTCAGLCLGLIVLFRSMFQRTNRWLAALATASLAAYVLHLMIVVGIQSAIETIDAPALAKFGFVTALASVTAFGLGHVSGRMPGARVVLGSRPTRRPDAPERAPTSAGEHPREEQAA